MDQLLPEDYLTCLAEDEQGVIWIGTRQNGTMLADAISGRRSYGTIKAMGYPDNFVTKILCLSGGEYLIGFYGGGIVKSIKPFRLVDRKLEKTRFNVAPIFSVTKKDFAKLPSPIDPPILEDILNIRAKINQLRIPTPDVYAAYYGEDWKTQGDWLGRKAAGWAIMCAAQSPYDRNLRTGQTYYKLHEFIGPNANDDDCIRRWLHWFKTDNPRTLWDPLSGTRRQAEWGDHGEAYPMVKDGPDLWYWFEISRDGMFCLRMYFFNKDGHDGNNRFRDYVIEIYPAKERFTGKPFDVWKKYSQLAEQNARLQKPLVKSRVHNFWGGVYKEFILPKGMYYVKIRRNYSFNTIMSAVILKQIQGKMEFNESFFIQYVTPCLPMNHPYRRLPLPFPEYCESQIGRLIIDTWNKLEEIYNKKGGIAQQQELKLNLYRKAQSLANEDEQLKQINKSIKWRLNQWDAEQRREWRETMEKAVKKLHEEYEQIREAVEAKEL
jgi:hypothetical protein